LGLVLKEEMRALGNDMIQLILAFTLPRTLKQLRVFLGVTGRGSGFGSQAIQI
jgi:hypothetical protein